MLRTAIPLASSPLPVLPSILMSRPHWSPLYQPLILMTSFLPLLNLPLPLFRTPPETITSFSYSGHGGQSVPMQSQGLSFSSHRQPQIHPRLCVEPPGSEQDPYYIFENWPQTAHCPLVHELELTSDVCSKLAVQPGE